MKYTLQTAEQLNMDWNNNPRWAGVARPYSAEDVVRLRGTVPVEHSLARRGADKLWHYLQNEPYVMPARVGTDYNDLHYDKGVYAVAAELMKLRRL